MFAIVNRTFQTSVLGQVRRITGHDCLKAWAAGAFPLGGLTHFWRRLRTTGLEHFAPENGGNSTGKRPAYSSKVWARRMGVFGWRRYINDL